MVRNEQALLGRLLPPKRSTSQSTTASRPLTRSQCKAYACWRQPKTDQQSQVIRLNIDQGDKPVLPKN